MLAEDFMKLDETVVHALRCWCSEEGTHLDEASARRVAAIEQSGYVVDLESRKVFQPDDRWQPFVNATGARWQSFTKAGTFSGLWWGWWWR